MKKVKNIPTYYTFPGTKIFRDTTALPFADGGPLHDRDINGKLLNSTYAPQLGDMFREGGPFKDDIGAFDYAKSIYASQLGDYYRTGGMLKRADGSYSPRGLWDNIRTNAGSGKAPTKQMLAQEKKINKQYKKGGPLLTNLTPEEEKQFQQFYQSLPDNLMQDDPEYDIRGYWDSEGRPQEFNFNQPKEDDGYYHAYSINQNTGEYLKSPSHHTFQRAIDEDRKIGYRPVTNVQGRNIATENESIIPPQEQSFLANTQGPVNFKKGGKLKKENNTNSEFGNIDIAPEGTREYQLANQPKASNYDQQYVDKAIEAAKLMYEDIGIYDKDDFLWSKMQSAVNPTEVFKLAKSNIYNDAYGKDRRDKVNIFGAKHHGSQMSTTLMRYFDAAIPPDLYPHFQGSAGYGSDIVNKNIEEPVRREFTQLAMPTLQRLPAVTIQNNNYPEETPVFNRTFRTGGQFPRPYSLPEDSFKQGGRNLHNSVYASSNAQYPAVYNFGGTLKNNLATRQQMYMPLDHITRNGGSILSMSNTPEMSGEGKDLTVPDNAYYYANGGNMNTPWLHNLYPNGGKLYTYADRPEAVYQKDDKGNWLIKLPSTNGQFVPLADPTGKRAGELNEKAVLMPSQFRKQYDALTDIKPQVAENTAIPNIPQSDPTLINQAIVQKQAERQVVAEKIKADPLLTDEQKLAIITNPQKLDENVHLAYAPGPDKVKAYTPTEQSIGDRITDIAFNPMTSLGYVVRGQEIPDNLQRRLDYGLEDRNTLDMVTDMTPVGAIHSANNIYTKATDNVDGNFWTANTALDVANILPTAKLIRSGLKGFKPTNSFNAPAVIPRIEANPNTALDFGKQTYPQKALIGLTDEAGRVPEGSLGRQTLKAPFSTNPLPSINNSAAVLSSEPIPTSLNIPENSAMGSPQLKTVLSANGQSAQARLISPDSPDFAAATAAIEAQKAAGNPTILKNYTNHEGLGYSSPEALIAEQAQEFKKSTDFAHQWGLKDPAKFAELSAKAPALKAASNQAYTNLSQAHAAAYDKFNTLRDNWLWANGHNPYDLEHIMTIADGEELAKARAILNEAEAAAEKDPKLIQLKSEFDKAEEARKIAIAEQEKLGNKMEQQMDPTVKAKIEKIFASAGQPMLPSNLAMQDIQGMISAPKLLYSDPAHPSYASLNPIERAHIESIKDRAGGVKLDNSTITFASKVSEPSIFSIETPNTSVQPEASLNPTTWFNPLKNPVKVPGSQSYVQVINEQLMHPEAVGSINAHEIGHDIQRFYSWVNQLQVNDPAFKYYTGTDKNPIAGVFKKFMVSPTAPVNDKYTTETWRSGVGELHSNLMIVRNKAAQKLVKEGIPLKEAINTIKQLEAAGDDKLFNEYLNSTEIKQHFNETATPEIRKQLLQYLPAVLGIIGTGAAMNANATSESKPTKGLKNGGYIPSNNFPNNNMKKFPTFTNRFIK